MLKAYYHLTKPGIIYGNLLSTLAGFFLASKGHIQIGLLLAVASGTALGIASACVLNNYIDRDIDRLMTRTKMRALANHTISGTSALIYAAVLGIVGFLILALWTNWLVLAAGFIGVVFYVILYGIAKRTSPISTAVGSIPGAIPPLAGYLAVTGTVDLGALLLFVIMMIWQLPHFYAISIFRIKDYAAAGLPVLSVKHGIKTTKIHIMLFIVAYMAIVPLLTLLDYTGYTYLTVMGAITLLWFWKGVQGFGATDATAWARKMFGFSLVVLLTFSFMLSVDIWLP